MDCSNCVKFFTAPVFIGTVWFILHRRNKERLTTLDEKLKVGHVKNEEGEVFEVNVVALDLTDLEDKTFIYPT